MDLLERERSAPGGHGQAQGVCSTLSQSSQQALQSHRAGYSGKLSEEGTIQQKLPITPFRPSTVLMNEEHKQCSLASHDQVSGSQGWARMGLSGLS